MSYFYASALSEYPDKGKLGAPELEEDAAALDDKIAKLQALIESARHMVVLTGAGISTAARISDFRSPSGTWTREAQGLPAPEAVELETVAPTLTHHVIAAWCRRGRCQFVITQNVDNLHGRSGVPAEQLAEVHGNLFSERCERCGAEFVREVEVKGIGLKPTGRRCAQPCGGRLRDTILDWEDALPEPQFSQAISHSRKADLILCLGTSLQIRPCCNLPLRTLRAGGKIAVVNLQATPKDSRAAVVIHARVDHVLGRIAAATGLELPPLRRPMVAHLHYRRVKAGDKIDFVLSGPDHAALPSPFVARIAVSFGDRARRFEWERQPDVGRATGKAKAVSFSRSCGREPLTVTVSGSAVTGDAFEVTGSLADAQGALVVRLGELVQPCVGEAPIKGPGGPAPPQLQARGCEGAEGEESDLDEPEEYAPCGRCSRWVPRESRCCV